MSKRVILSATVTGILLLAGGCAGNAPPTNATGPAAAVYTCTDGSQFVARSSTQDLATVQWMGRTYDLDRVESASGTRFRRDDVEYWERGGEAMLVIDGEERSGCVGTLASSRAEEARLLDVDLFAMGQEPGWILSIRDGGWLRFEGDYGATIVATTAPVVVAEGGRRTTYLASNEGRTITVEVRPTECLDSMSGEPFSHTVRVQYGDRSFSGCGRMATGS